MVNPLPKHIIVRVTKTATYCNAARKIWLIAMFGAFDDEKNKLGQHEYTITHWQCDCSRLLIA